MCRISFCLQSFKEVAGIERRGSVDCLRSWAFFFFSIWGGDSHFVRDGGYCMHCIVFQGKLHVAEEAVEKEQDATRAAEQKDADNRAKIVELQESIRATENKLVTLKVWFMPINRRPCVEYCYADVHCAACSCLLEGRNSLYVLFSCCCG